MGVQPNSHTNLADAVNQKGRRRRETLFKKASEYCSECGADICLILWVKKTGQIYTLVSESEGWPPSQNQLVSFASVTNLTLQSTKSTVLQEFLSSHSNPEEFEWLRVKGGG